MACNMLALSPEQLERYETVRRGLEKEIQQVKELPNGYAFRYPSETDVYLRVAEFVTLERLCCPFLTFTVSLGQGRGPLWMRITGREGVKAFLR